MNDMNYDACMKGMRGDGKREGSSIFGRFLLRNDSESRGRSAVTEIILQNRLYSNVYVLHVYTILGLIIHKGDLKKTV